MGRSIPSPSSHGPSIHPAVAIALPLLATIAILGSLCASRHRKPPTPKGHSPAGGPTSSSPGSNRSAKTNREVLPISSSESIEITAATMAGGDQQQDKRCASSEERISIDVGTHGPIAPCKPAVAVSGSRRKLSMSLSMKIPEGLAKIRTNKKERQEKAAVGAESSSSSIWTKTIILGERCRVPSEEEEEEDVLAYVDEKGNRQRMYHPRTPRSVPVSRTNSFIGFDASHS